MPAGWGQTWIGGVAGVVHGGGVMEEGKEILEHEDEGGGGAEELSK